MFLLTSFLYAPRAQGELAVARNFYGVVSVRDFPNVDPQQHYVGLVHGRILHGAQFTSAERRHWPATYFGERSGIGRALTHFAERPNLQVAITGLGIGSLAAYAQPGHKYTYYEINPDVVQMAQEHFTMLEDCRGEVEILVGDARLALERQATQQYDVFILDAFSGDAVPTHLLTKEAFEIYARHLAPGAVIAVNISNTYLDLAPVVCGLAQPLGMQALRVTSLADVEKGIRPADWMLLTRNREFLESLRRAEPLAVEPKVLPLFWTDDFSDLFQILK